MEFISKEIQNAQFTPSSITHTDLQKVDNKSIKDELKTSVFLRDSKLTNVYDMACMRKINSSSGNDVMKNLLYLIRDFSTNKFKDDDAKNLTVRKNFDIMILALEGLMINKIDCSSDEINTLILGFVSKNFL
jgi:hypothetical protein